MAVRTISTKLAIDGEAQYKQSIAACNAELKTLKSSLALVESEFKGNANSMAALTAKGTALADMQEKQAAKVAELEKALANAQRHQTAYAEAASEARQKVAEYSAALDALKNSTGDTQEEQAALTAELQKWKAAQDEADAANYAAAKGVQEWQRQLNNARVEQNNLSSAIEQNNQYLQEAEASADGCAKSIDQYGKAVKDAEKASEDFGDTSKGAIDQLAQAIVAAGLAQKVQEVAAAMYDCVETFASFEAQMSTVQAISGASGDELAALADKAKYMGSTTSFTATEAGQALEYMAMAGWKTEDMLDGLEGIMHLAAASGESLASTSDIVTDALTAFGLAASDSARFADVLAKASSNSNTNVQMMGETFKYAAPVAGALGYSIEDTALAVGLMANAGIKGSQSGTALRTMLTNLAKPSKEVAGYMKALDVSLTDSSGRMFSLSSLMAVLRDRFSQLTEAEKAQYAAGLAGKEAMSGLLAIVNASDQDFQKLTAAINDCAGAAYDMSQIRLDNYAGQITLLDSAVDGLKLTIGSQLAPVLRLIAEGATDAVNGLTELLEACPGLTAVLAGVTAAAGLLTAAFAGFSIVKSITALLIPFNAALAANPAGLVAVGIAAVVAAVGTFAASCADAEDAAGSLNQKLEEIEGSYQNTSTKTMATATAAEQLVSKLEALERQESMTEGETALYAQTVDKLRALLPDVNFEIDEQTGKLKDGAVAVRNLTKEWKEQALAQALQDKYQAVLFAQADALVTAAEKQLDYNDALAAYTDVQRQIAETEEAINQVLSDSSLTDEERLQRLSTLEGIQRELGLRNTEVSLSLEEQEIALNAANKAAQAFDEEIRRLNETEELLVGGNEQGAESYVLMQAKIEDIIATAKELEAAYQENYFEAYDSISKQVGLFEELDGTAQTSIGNLIDALKSQVTYMETYAENIQRAMELGVDQGLIQKLSDGSEESARILAAIVEGGKEDIAELNEQLAKVEEGKKNFSKTVAEMENDFNKKMSELAKDLDEAIQDMDMREFAYQIGANNVQGLINGSVSKKGALAGTYAEMGKASLAAYKRAVQQQSPSKEFYQAGSFDIKGVINGAESEKANLDAAYADLARTAMDAMEQALHGAELPAYSPEADYSTLMLAAKNLEEFIQLAAQRNAKIIGEHIDVISDGYVSNAQLLEQWLATADQAALQFEKTVDGVSYRPDVDYSALMLAAENLEEFEQLAAKRTAKIVGEHIDMVANGYADNIQLLEQWKRTVEQTMDSIEKSVNGVSYDPDVDYSALMLQAENLEEFQKLAAQRSAKIAGENIDMVAQGYAGNEELLEKWSGTVKKSSNTLVDSVTEMESEFAKKMEALQESMRFAEEAYKTGADNIRGFIDGAASMQTALVNQYTEMARAALAAYTQEIQQGKFDAAYTELAQSAKDSAETFLPSTQLAFRPLGQERQTDAIVAALSRLETGNGGGQGGIPAAELAAAVREALDGAFVQLDGRRVGQLITDRQNYDNKAWGR